MLLALFSHAKDSFRVMALTCINSLISLAPQALLLNMDAYLEVGGQKEMMEMEIGMRMELELKMEMEMAGEVDVFFRLFLVLAGFVVVGWTRMYLTKGLEGRTEGRGLARAGAGGG